VKVWGLLCWYEEPESWLTATVGSLRGFCDGLIAVDGPYATFPGALRVPRSDPGQAETIQRAAWAADLITCVYTPKEAWWAGDEGVILEEVVKRDFMFKLADSMADPGDWYFVIDADESVHNCPVDARLRLEQADEDVAEVHLWHRPDEFYPSRRLFRGPGVKVEEDHYNYVKNGQHLGWTPYMKNSVPAVDLHDLVVAHRIQHRSDYRKQQKAQYYEMRNRMMEAMGLTKEWTTDGSVNVTLTGG
jgi:hypothetical protein